MLLLTGIAIFFILLLLGFGYFITRLFWRKDFSQDIFDIFWIGFCVLIAFLQIWHFFLPINGWLFALITFLAAAGVLMRIKDGLPPLRRAHIFYAIGLILPLIVLLNHTLFSDPSYDHGLYHLQTVKWFNQFAIVPGLGNLQHRLAFNSSQYLYAAFINSSIFTGYAYYVASVILAYMLLLQSLQAFGVWLRGGSLQAVVVYRVLLIPVILWHVSTEPLAGYSADLGVFVLQAVLFAKLLQWMNIKSDDKDRKILFSQILILAVTGVTIKLSFGIFAAVAIVIALIYLWQQVDRLDFFKQLIPVGLITFSVWIVPWLVRNVILSGYLLYPNSKIRFNLPWTMPGYLANNLQYIIGIWAKTNSDSMAYTADFPWLLKWVKSQHVEIRFTLFFAVVLLAGLILISFLKRYPRLSWKEYPVLLVGISLAVLFWFFSAPAYRFSGAVIWLWILTVILMVWKWILINFSDTFAWRVTIITLILLFILLPTNLSRNMSLSRSVIVPPEQVLDRQKLNGEATEVRTTNSGLQINIAPDEACWDLPLPCTSPNDFMKSLRLIDPTDMGKGFMVESSK